MTEPLVYIFCVYMCVCLFFTILAFFQSTERGSRDGWNMLIFKVSLLTLFFLVVMRLCCFLYLSYLSLSCTRSLSFSLFLSLTRSLSLFGHSDIRFWITASLALQESFLVLSDFPPLKFLLLLLMSSVTEDAFFFFFCGFF